MGRFRYSYSVSGRSAEELSETIDRMAKLGYDAVELGGELSPADAGEVRALVESAGMTVSSICPSFTAKRDPRERRRGAPSHDRSHRLPFRSRPLASEKKEWEWAVESIRDGGEYAGALGVNLTLECWNRYGTYLLNRLEQAVRLWRETGLSNSGVMADTYHMNIEERSLPGAIRERGNCSTTSTSRIPTKPLPARVTRTSDPSCKLSRKSTTAVI